MNELPDETTEFISEVCKDKGLTSFPCEYNGLNNVCLIEKAEPSDYLHIFVNKPQHLLKFLEKMVAVSVYNKFTCLLLIGGSQATHMKGPLNGILEIVRLI